MVKSFYLIVASFSSSEQCTLWKFLTISTLNLFKSRYCCGSVDDCDHITNGVGNASGVANESYIYPLVHCHLLGDGVDSLVSNAL